MEGIRIDSKLANKELLGCNNNERFERFNTGNNLNATMRNRGTQSANVSVASYSDGKQPT